MERFEASPTALRRGRSPSAGHSTLRPRCLARTLLGGVALATLLGPDPAWAEVSLGYQTLTTGLQYRDLAVSGRGGRPGFGLHVFRVDLRHFEARIADARKPTSRKMARVDTLARELGAALAVNGTFFLPDDRPIGLLIDRGKRLNPLRKADWGVLFVQGGKARLVHTRDWHAHWDKRPDIDFAIQVGPRVVVAGKPLKLKAQTARRAALGVLPDGRLSVAISHGPAVESNDLAHAMRDLGCQDAFMVDGGPSAQLWARIRDFQLHQPGGWPVPNAVVFVPRGGHGDGESDRRR